MKILLRVNQQAALIRGIDAPTPTITLDVDPATLTQAERDVLADVLVDGHDARRDLLLLQPDLVGLREAIQALLDEREQKREATRQARATVAAEARRRLETLMSSAPKKCRLRLRMDGTVTHWDSEAVACGSYLETATAISYSDLSQEDAARYDGWKVAAEASNALALAAATERLGLEVAKKQAEAKDEAAAEAEAKAKIEAEREVMIARLPEPFRARIKGGYATDNEVASALRSLARVDAGLAMDHDSYKVSRTLDVLTDDEFSALERVKADIANRLPDAIVVPMVVADKFATYRKATNDDEQDDIDEDGDVLVDDANLRRRIVVRWQVAGITIAAGLPFDITKWQSRNHNP